MTSLLLPAKHRTSYGALQPVSYPSLVRVFAIRMVRIAMTSRSSRGSMTLEHTGEFDFAKLASGVLASAENRPGSEIPTDTGDYVATVGGCKDTKGRTKVPGARFPAFRLFSGPASAGRAEPTQCRA
jgi:hypothetical protein